MSYASIPNLYNNATILNFKEAFALEKVHGCLKKGTLVRLADGKEIPIERIKSGDNITVFNEAIGKFSEAPVIDLIVQESDPRLGWVEVRLENGRTLVCTVDHPFLTSNRGWISAGHLTLDDDIIAHDR